MSSPYIPLALPNAPTNFGMPNMNPMALGSGGFDPQNITADVPMFSQPMPAPAWQSTMSSTVGMGSPVAAPTAGLMDSLSSWLPKGFMDQYNPDTGMKTGQGWGGMAMGAASGIANAFMGMQQYGLAKKALAQSKEQFDKNYGAQRTTTNSALEDRQRARVASNSSAYESVGSYMDRNAVR